MIHHYGPSAHQVVEILEPERVRDSAGVIVLIHGGYWRAKFDRSLMAPLAQDLLSGGWVVANVEYRRIGAEGGWPVTADDVRQAIQFVGAWTAVHGKRGPVIGIGHSVGGQLALLAAPFLDAIVALAPVTDVARAEREGLGENAVLEFMRAGPVDAPREYEDASPICQLPLSRPQLLVHGDLDARVPVDHSRSFLAAARKRGEHDVSLVILPGMGHLEVIDPLADHWAGVLSWLATVTLSGER